MQWEASILIDRTQTEVFEFLCSPTVDRAELTPMEDRIVEGGEVRGVGPVCRATLEFAARTLSYAAYCTGFQPPRGIACRLEGDIEGTHAWRLAPEGHATRLELVLDIVPPKWMPAYLRDQTTATRWGQMLIDQFLANVKGQVGSR